MDEPRHGAKTMKRTSSLLLAAMVASVAAIAACDLLPADQSGGGGPPDSGLPPEPGTDLPGLGSASAPTADAVIGRIRNTLIGVDPLLGNFAKAIAQVKPNLPQMTNPVQATGLDQIPLLVYAACTDTKLASYSVPTTGTVSANSAALVAAGMKMLDGGLAGLASQGSSSVDFQAALQALVSTLGADKATTQTMTTSFIAVCMASTTAAVSMAGY
jgi:hypothetical protein